MLQNTRLEARGRYQNVSAAEMRCREHMERRKGWEKTQKSLANLEESLSGWNEFLH
jgi:hypothetical protein